MDTIVTATIGGAAHGLQFHSARITQNLFSACELRLELGFGDADAPKVITKATSDWIGKELALTVSDRLDKAIEKKYSGTIHRIQVSNVNLLLVAYSPDFLMGAVRKHASYLNKDVVGVVKDVLSANGVTHDLKGPQKSIMFDFLQQYEETDYDFLKRVAFYDGCVFFNDGEKLYYREKLGGGASVTLGLEHVSDVVLDCLLSPVNFRGMAYDPTKHTDISGSAVQSAKFTPPGNPHLTKAYDASKNVYQNAVEDVFTSDVLNKNDFDRLLVNFQKTHSGRQMSVKGNTNHPMVAIGRTISCAMHPILKTPVVVAGLRAEFSGNVYKAEFLARAVDATVFPEEAESYHPQALHAEKSDTIKLGMLEPAIVTDDKDPMNLGRVKVQYIWDVDNSVATWARVASAGAGKSHGTHFTPRIADQVLIGYERGDPSMPVVLGALYQSDDKPDFKTKNGTEEVLLALTSGGTEVRLLDKQGSEEVVISMNGGKNLLRMELKQPKITLESVGGTISINAKDIEVKADNKFTVTATNVEISAQAEAKIAGTTAVKLQGAQIESQASATNVIKGGMVQIN